MKTLPISGISPGDSLSFRGIAQHKVDGFKAYVAPDYSQVMAQIRQLHPWQSVIAVYDQTVSNIQSLVDSLAFARMPRAEARGGMAERPRRSL